MAPPCPLVVRRRSLNATVTRGRRREPWCAAAPAARLPKADGLRYHLSDMRIKRIHHLTLAVRNVEDARITFGRLFGAPAPEPSPLDALGVLGTTVPMGDDTLRLVSPLEGDNPVTRFLERRGEGFYNLALEVEDLDEAVDELAAKGVRVSEPAEVEPGLRSAFVAMAATHGLSIQLVEVTGGTAGSPSPWAEPQAESGSAAPVEEAPLDLTPDEWSDTD